MPLARREMQDASSGFRLLRTSAEPSSKTMTSTQSPLVMLSELVVTAQSRLAHPLRERERVISSDSVGEPAHRKL